MLSNLGNAYALATAIYAGKESLDIEDAEYRIYKVMDACPMFHSDEAKADVYAQLAEKLTATTPFAEAVSIIQAALNETTYAIGQHG